VLKLTGIALLGLASSAFAQLAGPAILSRGEAPTALVSPQLSFRPYATIEGVYDGGLEGVSVTPQGTLQNVGSAGLKASWGINGAHSWRHTRLGLQYQGAAQHYQVSGFDTLDQALLLGISHQFTPRAQLVLRESAGTFSRTFSVPGLSQTVPFDPVASYIPTVDFFDNRTYYMTSQADLTVQLSKRLTFNVGGDGFVERRRSSALAGAVGAAARGDIEYRLSRFSTIGVNYNFTHYAFTRVAGGTDFHAISGGYSVRMSRTLEFSAYAGIAQVESKFVESVPIDPVISALLGISYAAQVVHTKDLQPNLAGRLSKKYSRGVLFVSGGHSVTPGNGLFLTSYTTNALGGYTYTGLRRWSFTTSGMYSRSQATGQLAGGYATTVASFSTSRQVNRIAHLVWGVDMRRYTSGDFAGYNRNTYDVHGGVGFSPGDLPFRLW
jgi:hypothetical protein